MSSVISQIWNSTGDSALLSWRLPAMDGCQEGSVQSMSTNAACVTMAPEGHFQICVGSSSGKIYAFSVLFDNYHPKFHCTGGVEGHCHPITALGSSLQSHQGIDQGTSANEDSWKLWTDLVSGDESGAVVVWNKMEVAYRIEETCTPCVSIVVKEGYFLLGRLNGCLELYTLVRHLNRSGLKCKSPRISNKKLPTHSVGSHCYTTSNP